MNLKLFIKRLLFYISVPSCVFCKERLDFEDKGLCKACKAKYENHKMRDCSRCGKMLNACTCTTEYLGKHNVKRHIKLFRYMKTDDAEPGKHLIYSLKRDNREDVIEFLSSEIETAINNSIDLSKPQSYIITNVPRRSTSIIKYGFDHTAELAKALSVSLGIEYKKLLISKSKLAQKQTKGENRLTNVDFDYDAKCKDVNLEGRVALIVDDLVTTGASMSSAAMLVRGLGAKECIAVSISLAHNEDYGKNK